MKIQLTPTNQRLLIKGGFVLGCLALFGWLIICWQKPAEAADVLRVWFSH